MALSIIDQELKCGRNDTLKYGGSKLNLNKRMLFIGDEMQDLDIEYSKAMIKICIERHCDFYTVGDELQSISLENNAFTYLKKLETNNDIFLIFEKEKNDCRRIKQQNLIDFVNNMVPFEEFNLLPISGVALDSIDIESCNKFQLLATSKTDNCESQNFQSNLKTIMDLYIKEATINNREAKDFLIITPFTSTNPLCDALVTDIRKFWRNKDINDQYIKHCIFHKSETGTSIDLSASDNATRIVSIHSSKGDGRPVVFVIGVTEKTLKCFCNDTNIIDTKPNIIYESLLHVAVTRMKHKLYFGYVANNDDIHRRMSETNNDIIPCLSLKNNYECSKLVKSNIEKTFQTCKKLIIDHAVLESLEKEKDDKIQTFDNKMIIDIQEHITRYMCMHNYLFFATSNNTNTNIYHSKQPSYQILMKCARAKIVKCSTASEYYTELYRDTQDISIPLIKYEDSQHEYKQYFLQLYNKIKNIQKRLLVSLQKNITNISLDYIDSIVLHYIIDIIEHKYNFNQLCEINHHKKIVRYLQVN